MVINIACYQGSMYQKKIPVKLHINDNKISLQILAK